MLLWITVVGLRRRNILRICCECSWVELLYRFEDFLHESLYKILERFNEELEIIDETLERIRDIFAQFLKRFLKQLPSPDAISEGTPPERISKQLLFREISKETPFMIILG